MKLFRSILFWAHLATGLVAGLVIAVMCFTGAALAFEHEIVAWAERDARQVPAPAADAPRLSIDELRQKLREAQPEFRPNAVTVINEPTAAVLFAAGRDGGHYANPYTGEIKQPASVRVHEFMHVMTDWHRYLALAGDNRPHGKLVTGICNLAFCGLALTGLYLWWPRTLTWRGLKAVAIFNWRLTGKAREFNWHNSIGLWTAPVLVVLTLTAVPISFRWGGDLIYRLTGEEPPAATGPAAAPAVEIKHPSPDARPLPQADLLARVQATIPGWEQITLRTGPGRGPGAPARPAAAGGANPAAESPAARSEPRTPQAITATVREAGSWPRTATTTLTLDPFTGQILQRTGYAELSPARKIRSWTRFLHTGQALGWPGQLVAGLACLGGLFLVYTGYALSARRFFGRKPAATSAAQAAAVTERDREVLVP